MKHPYFQFPIYLLAHVSGATERLADVISYCILEIGKAEVSKITPEEAKQRASATRQEYLPQGFELSDMIHLRIVAGQLLLKVRGGNCGSIWRSWSLLTNFVANMTEQFGFSPLVRIRAAFILETIKNKGMSLRELSVLCAVYSIIGSKKYPVRITRDRIRACALGFKSASLLFDKDGILHETGKMRLDEWTSGAQPLTVDKLRWTLDSLEGRGLFVRASPNKRQTYFSHRMTGAQIRAKLKISKSRANFRRISARAADKILQKEIQATNNSIKPIQTGGPCAVPTLIEKSKPIAKSIPQVVPTGHPPRPHAAPTGVPTIIETGSYKLSSKKLSSEKLPSQNLSKQGERERRSKVADDDLKRPPTRQEVEEFAKSLHCDATDEDIAAWWLLHGGAAVESWKRNCARFVLARITARKRCR